MQNEYVCPICGKPTKAYMGNYRKDRLCAKHAEELKNNKIVKCEKCNKYHPVDKKCSCEIEKVYTELPSKGFEECIICKNKTNGYAFCKDCWNEMTNEEMLDALNKREQDNKKKDKVNESEKKQIIKKEDIDNLNTTFIKQEVDQNTVIKINENNKSICIACGKKTDGLLFCSSCYFKYKDKELLVKITKCSSVEILDEDYEGRYTCKDGHVVKSKSERDIDNYLFEHDIKHAYEKELSYGRNETDVIHPDFYLPDYLGSHKDVYIEHWGYNENNIKYFRTKKYKLPIYQKLCDEKQITLICTDEKQDAGKIDSVLDRKLNKKYIIENTINYNE